MEKRTADREQKRRAILKAAGEVFARKGFEQATLEEVAREAGLAKGTIYLYFRNKEALCFHSAVEVMSNLESSIVERARSTSNALDQLRAIAVGQFDFFVRHRDALRLLAPFSNPSLIRLHRRLIAALMEKWTAHLQRITSLVEEGQRGGAIRRDFEPRQIGLAFIGMTNQAAQAMVHLFPLAKPGAPASGPGEAEPQPTPEGMADTIMRILLEGVMDR